MSPSMAMGTHTAPHNWMGLKRPVWADSLPPTYAPSGIPSERGTSCSAASSALAPNNIWARSGMSTDSETMSMKAMNMIAHDRDTVELRNSDSGTMGSTARFSCQRNRAMAAMEAPSSSMFSSSSQGAPWTPREMTISSGAKAMVRSEEHTTELQ